MKIFDIVKKIGTGLLRETLPGKIAGGIIATANEFLPDKHKLPENASGEDLQGALAGLTPEARAELLRRDLDVQGTFLEEQSASLQAMLAAEQSNKHTTRPKIALHAFYLVAMITATIVLGWFIAVAMDRQETVALIMDGWEFVLAAISPFVVWLNQYFGVLRKESRDRLDAAAGMVPGSSRGIMAGAKALLGGALR